MACYFLERSGGQLKDLKLMKLMYLAERESIRLRNVGITFDRFFSMRNGPVLSSTLDRMTPQDHSFDRGVWREHIDLPERRLVRLLKPMEAAEELSRREIAILEDVWAQFGSWDKWSLVDHVHSFKEWQDPGDSSIPIAFQDILAAFGFGFSERKSRYAEYVALQEA